MKTGQKEILVVFLFILGGALLIGAVMASWFSGNFRLSVFLTDLRIYIGIAFVGIGLFLKKKGKIN
jgi:hypothetical protein